MCIGKAVFGGENIVLVGKDGQCSSCVESICVIFFYCYYYYMQYTHVQVLGFLLTFCLDFN